MTEHAAPILTVSSSLGVDAMVSAVEALFAQALAEGPRAETVLQRRALLREANIAIACQVHGYYGRPWAEGHADSVIRDFVCECDDPECDEVVRLSAEAFPNAADPDCMPVLVDGHSQAS